MNIKQNLDSAKMLAAKALATLAQAGLATSNKTYSHLITVEGN